MNENGNKDETKKNATAGCFSMLEEPCGDASASGSSSLGTTFAAAEMTTKTTISSTSTPTTTRETAASTFSPPTSMMALLAALRHQQLHQQQQSQQQQFSSLLCQERVNQQLGGKYINGRPLPYKTRCEIVRMNKQGIKPVRISRDLKVSHGVVSKILNRTWFNATGSIQPGQIGGPNPRHRLSIQAVRGPIQQIRGHDPDVNATEVQQILVERGLCLLDNAPTKSAINRFLKSMKNSSERPPGSTTPASSVENHHPHNNGNGDNHAA